MIKFTLARGICKYKAKLYIGISDYYFSMHELDKADKVFQQGIKTLETRRFTLGDDDEDNTPPEFSHLKQKEWEKLSDSFEEFGDKVF
jgi:hypothetical protein